LVPIKHLYEGTECFVSPVKTHLFKSKHSQTLAVHKCDGQSVILFAAVMWRDKGINRPALGGLLRVKTRRRYKTAQELSFSTARDFCVRRKHSAVTALRRFLCLL